MTTAKQKLAYHLRNQHHEQFVGTLKQLEAAHKADHAKRHLTHKHRIERWDDEGNQILAVDDQIHFKIFLSPPKNPGAARNGDRNWTINITGAGGGWRWEMPGTWEGDPKGAKETAAKILGWTPNWVTVGWGFQHEEVSA
jgi:hypothetical protein